MKKLKQLCSAVLALAAAVCITALPVRAAEGDTTYTVTANLYVPGELNTQLPGVTAYVTNGNNPLGLGGYDAVAPTTPVSNNATLTVASDGALTLEVPIPNPVFTIQAIGGCSNASIVSAPRDAETYATQDGSVSRTGRITSLKLELLDESGKYVFTECTEFPTLLGVDWTVPLTLEVDLSGVELPSGAEQPEETQPSAQKTPTAAVNTDGLTAIVKTVEQAAASAVISKDGNDVETSKVWNTQADLDTLKTELAKAKAALSAADQATADSAEQALKTAYASWQKAQQSGKLQAQTENLGKTLSPGTYTVTANIWFNKADTGLPLNPHLTNSTFPPYNPVPDNAQLTVNEDGTASLVIPIVIKDKVMTLRELRGPTLTDVQKTEDGAITSITVDLGQLTGDSTVVSDTWEADIEMGDLAMSISGLDKPHTWPAQFELNLSGVATTDGGVMPTVELELIDNIAATEAMASVGANAEAGEDAENNTEPEAAESESSAAMPVVVVAVVVLAAAGAAFAVKKGKKGGK